jgi:sigma-B regulation protein RsbU (phosphoserine phosphatase)
MSPRTTQADILKILDQVANEVSGELELPRVLRNIARLIRQVIDYSHLVIALLDENQRFQWVLQEGYTQEALDALHIGVESGIIGEAVRSKEIILVGDVQRHPLNISIPSPGGTVTRSELAVPLMSKDTAIGAVVLESTKSHAFSEAHRLMMRSIAAHLASAVANARLHEQTLEQVKTLTIIERIGRELTSVLDLNPLLSDIARLIKMVIDYQAFGIFLVDRERGEFVNHLAIGYDKETLQARPVKLEEGIRGQALRHGRSILVDDVLKDPQHVKLKLESEEVVRSQMVVPLLTKNKIVGVLVLANVKPGFYTERHLRIATGVANQIAIALENSRVFEEVAGKEEMMRDEMEIARRLQKSMLPARNPAIPGFEIAADSTPAITVGGDFYDFIELDGGRWGIVVGDVSGYSLPGALVMSSAREVVRIYSEFDPDPAVLMKRAGTHLSSGLGKHMFVALLYGVLDPEKRTFTFCNAGLVEPAFLRRGRARFVPTKSNRFPLGKFPHLEYTPRTIHLKRGDTLVLATDGTIEAWDHTERPFGFRRFLRTLSQASSRSAPAGGQELIGVVQNALTNFVGHCCSQDDVTIVTIRVL